VPKINNQGRRIVNVTSKQQNESCAIDIKKRTKLQDGVVVDSGACSLHARPAAAKSHLHAPVDQHLNHVACRNRIR
jgi:hypothetical protein